MADQPANELTPLPSDSTYGFFSSSPMYASSTHWLNYMSSLVTTLQSKSATAQGVTAYTTAMNAGFYRVSEWQNDMQLTQLKQINANLLELRTAINNVNTSIQNSGTGTTTPTTPEVSDLGTTNALLLFLIGLMFWRIVVTAFQSKHLLH